MVGVADIYMYIFLDKVVSAAVWCTTYNKYEQIIVPTYNVMPNYRTCDAKTRPMASR